MRDFGCINRSHTQGRREERSFGNLTEKTARQPTRNALTPVRRKEVGWTGKTKAWGFAVGLVGLVGFMTELSISCYVCGSLFVLKIRSLL
jgi:hypothetical protein